MPNHQSAWKCVKQHKKRNSLNKATKSQIKTAQNSVIAAVNDNNKEAVKDALMSAIRTISKGCTKKAIHKNNRSRKISRITKKANAVLLSPPNPA